MQELIKMDPECTKYHNYLASAMFYLGMYQEAEKECMKGIFCSIDLSFKLKSHSQSGWTAN
jgi:hypothetical protein